MCSRFPNLTTEQRALIMKMSPLGPPKARYSELAGVTMSKLMGPKFEVKGTFEVTFVSPKLRKWIAEARRGGVDA